MNKHDENDNDILGLFLVLVIGLVGAFFFIPCMILIIFLGLSFIAFALAKELLLYFKYHLFHLLGLKEDHFKAWYEE